MYQIIEKKKYRGKVEKIKTIGSTYMAATGLGENQVGNDTYIHTYIRTYVHTYIHTYVHTYIHTYIRMYVRTLYAYCGHGTYTDSHTVMAHLYCHALHITCTH